MPRLREINQQADATLRHLAARLTELKRRHARLKELDESPHQFTVGAQGFSVGLGGGRVSENESHILSLCARYGV